MYLAARALAVWAGFCPQLPSRAVGTCGPEISATIATARSRPHKPRRVAGSLTNVKKEGEMTAPWFWTALPDGTAKRSTIGVDYHISFSTPTNDG